MKVDNINITYVFLRGRVDRINSNQEHALEMFYSYFFFKKNYKNTNIIEFYKSEKNNKGIRRSLIYIDKFLKKLLRLPIYTSAIVSFENIKKYLRSDYLILTNDRVACSSLPILLLNKLFGSTNVSFFVLGLFKNKPKYRILYPLQKIYIKALLFTTNNVFFLGEGELNYAKKNYPSSGGKFHFLPFSIDSNFWKNSNEGGEKKGVVFVGNDGNRDFQKLIEICESLPKIQFTLVTKMITPHTKIPVNTKVISGSWGSNELTDEDLRDLYSTSKLTILPLKNSLQPSGQSVTLQSMAVGTPVLISNTEGFWEKDKFKNNENIFFVDDNSVSNWAKIINSLYKNETLLSEVASNGINTIVKFYKIERFDQDMKKFLGI